MEYLAQNSARKAIYQTVTEHMGNPERQTNLHKYKSCRFDVAELCFLIENGLWYNVSLLIGQNKLYQLANVFGQTKST